VIPRPTLVPEETRAAYELALSSLGQHREVTGVDVGYKYVAGSATSSLCVRIHVERKRRLDDVARAQIIPRTFLDIPTDVMQARYSGHSMGQRPVERHDRVQPGISIGNQRGETGTLGLIVFDRASGAPCVLSAHHVLVGAFGDIGDPITQPARIDQGREPADVIAVLEKAPAKGLWGDAALARLTDNRPADREQLGSSRLITSVGTPQLDQILEKSGRTTGITRGRVEGIGTYFYPGMRSGVRGFRLVPAGPDQPLTEDLSAVGDSGAVWYDPETNTGVGLHCAGDVGDPSHEFAVACYLSRVMAVLDVVIEPHAP
jgi:hypothetical protein